MYPDSKFRVVYMGPIWVLLALDGPHVGPMNLVIRVDFPRMRCSVTCTQSHLQSFATPPPRVSGRRREVIRHADSRNWEKMENVEFRSFLSITARKSYCISKMTIFETVNRLLTCDYSPKNNTMSHLLPAVIWWPSSRYIYRCLLIGEKLNSVKFTWHYLMS